MTAPTFVGTATAGNNIGAGTVTVSSLPSGLQLGDYVVVVIASNAKNLTLPSGWSWVKQNVVTGTLTTAVIAKAWQTGETSYSAFTMSAAAYATWMAFGVHGADILANWVTGTDGIRATNGTSTTNVAPSLTTAAADTRSVVISNDRTTTDEPSAPTLSSGTQYAYDHHNGGTAITTTNLSYTDYPTSGSATTAVTLTYTQVQASNGYAFQLGVPAPAGSPSGTATFAGSGALTAAGIPTTAAAPAFTGSGTLTALPAGAVSGTATLSGAGSLTSSGTPAVPTAVALSGLGSLTALQLSPVAKHLATSPIYVAHRGGSADWPEETLYSYQQAAAWNAQVALEISVWPSSDGVWVCSHDQNTSRVFGTSLDIPTTTWATLSSLTTTSGGKPIARIEDVLNALAFGDRVFYVDDKPQSSTTALLNLLDSYGGKDRFIAKGAGASTIWADAAAARGYQGWGYYYHTDVSGGALPASQSHWTLLGMDSLVATQPDWTAAQQYGKRVLAHIIASAAQKTVAASYNPNGYMASGVLEVVPQLSAGTLSGSGTLAAAGVPTLPAAAALSGAGTLTVAVVPGGLAAPTFAGAGVLAASGSPSTAVTAALSGLGTLTVTAAGSGSAAPAFSGAGALSVSGTPRPVVTAALSGSGTLAASASLVAVSGVAALTGSGVLATGASASATPAFTGAGVLTVGATVTIGGVVSFTGSGALTAAVSPAITGAITLTGSGTLTAAATAAAIVAPVFTGSGALTATTAAGLLVVVGLSGSGLLVASGLIPPLVWLDLLAVLPGPLWKASLPGPLWSAALPGPVWSAYLPGPNGRKKASTMIDQYTLGTSEFIPITLTNNGVPITDATNVFVSLVPWPAAGGADPSSWSAAVGLNGLIGFYGSSITAPGMYGVYVKAGTAPQVPIKFAGRIQMY